MPNRTVTDIIHTYFDGKLAQFRRGLLGIYKVAFDDLVDSAYKQRLPESLAGVLQPFQAFLLSGWLEDHVELLKLREMAHDVKRLRAEVENLRRKLSDKGFIE